MPQDKTTTLQSICDALLRGKCDEAAYIARKHYPFEPRVKVKRKYTKLQSMRIFLRDGFIDRYAGSRLVHPAVLRLLTKLLPDEFPFQSNWKMSETHMVFWEMFPTIDHLLPVARGGVDGESNWVTTSMLHNGAKAQWTLEELGWKCLPPGNLLKWDGLTRWFLDYVGTHNGLRDDNYVDQWYRASVEALRSNQGAK